MTNVRVLGAGLAGSEAAWQIAQAGIAVEIIEMRPGVMTKAHSTGLSAELVCSNSFRGAALSNAVGLLKEELAKWGSLIMEAAAASEVPAGAALAVDRELFSLHVDAKLRAHPLISFSSQEVVEVPEANPEWPVIIASGPLTTVPLARSIEAKIGCGMLSFYDAISPIILDESIDHSQCFCQSRYQKGSGDDYLNIPLNEEQYNRFLQEVLAAEKHHAHENVEHEELENIRPFEGCMPIEDMAERGPETLLFGPLKPVGLLDPKTGKRPHAVIQLRHDDKAGSLWSMVGMQTRMKHPEQTRIFKSLPGLQNAEFVRLGSVHRNTFINSPKCLNPTLELRSNPGMFFAGQLTGTEGYVEATAGGLLAGINAALLLKGKPMLKLPLETSLGALIAYISDPERTDFQPMNVNFGLMPCYLNQEVRNEKGRKIPKKDRRIKTSEFALGLTEQLLGELRVSLGSGGS